MRKALIVGGVNVNTLSLVEALGQKGVKPDLIITDWRRKNYISKSKYVGECHNCTSRDSLSDVIIRHYGNHPEKPVCIVSGDNEEFYIDNDYSSLNEVLTLPGIEPPGTVASWMNKQRMTEEADTVGLSIPKTWMATIGEDAPMDITFPCVTKGITSVSSGKVESKLFNDRNSLNVFLHGKHLCDRIQIQQFIEKEYEFQYIGVSLHKGEEIYIPGRTIIDEVYNFDNLTPLRFECSTGNPDTLKKAKAFICKTEYSGLFSVEFLHGKDGKDYFLEMNFRNDGNCNAVTSAGANLPYIWYLYCSGGDYLDEIKETEVHETVFCPGYLYFNLVVEGKVSLWKWLSSMRKANCYSTLYKQDMKPFWHSLFYENGRPVVKKIVKRMLGK